MKQRMAHASFYLWSQEKVITIRICSYYCHGFHFYRIHHDIQYIKIHFVMTYFTDHFFTPINHNRSIRFQFFFYRIEYSSMLCCSDCENTMETLWKITRTNVNRILFKVLCKLSSPTQKGDAANWSWHHISPTLQGLDSSFKICITKYQSAFIFPDKLTSSKLGHLPMFITWLIFVLNL